MRRVTALGVVVVLAVATGCAAEEDSSPSPASQACDIPEEADLSTADGWLSYFAQHLDDVSLVVEDDDGNRVEHRGDEVHPAASSIKVVHLLAYARAVHDGELDPRKRWASRNGNSTTTPPMAVHTPPPWSGSRLQLSTMATA